MKDAFRFAALSPEENTRETLRQAVDDFKCALTTLQQELNAAHYRTEDLNSAATAKAKVDKEHAPENITTPNPTK